MLRLIRKDEASEKNIARIVVARCCRKLDAIGFEGCGHTKWGGLKSGCHFGTTYGVYKPEQSVKTLSLNHSQRSTVLQFALALSRKAY